MCFVQLAKWTRNLHFLCDVDRMLWWYLSEIPIKKKYFQICLFIYGLYTSNWASKHFLITWYLKSTIISNHEHHVISNFLWCVGFYWSKLKSQTGWIVFELFIYVHITLLSKIICLISRLICRFVLVVHLYVSMLFQRLYFMLWDDKNGVWITLLHK